jgi:glycosyltransferase involved in cell wall biosynthesis
MRILYVLTDAKIGGAETLVETLALHRTAGDAVGLAVLLGRDELSPRLEAAFDFVDYLEVSEDSRNLWRMVRGIEEVVKRYRPDVIHSNLFHADLVTLLARSSGIPKITTIHTQGFGPTDHPLTKLIARAVGLLSFRFALAVPTPGSAEFARKLGFRRVSDTIPNSSNLSHQSLFNSQSRTFSSIGRFHPVKGHRVLFAAFAEVLAANPDWKLLCTGPGMDASNDELMSIVRGAGLEEALNEGSLILNGSTNNVQEVLARSSVLVISSLYGETFPMVGVEANGAGIPAIATDVGMSGAFTFDGTYIVPPGDAGTLALAMSRYAALNDSDRKMMSEAVRARAVRDFDPRRLVERYRDIYKEVVLRRN